MVKNKIAQIIPLTRLKRNLHYFDYLVPENILGRIKRGQLVDIPFRNKNIKGVIFALANQPDKANFKLKDIKEIIDPLPFLHSWQLDLIKDLADYYAVSMSVFLKMIVPEIPKRLRVSHDKFLDEVNFLGPIEPAKDIAEYWQNAKPGLLRYYGWENKIAVYLGLINKILKSKKQVAIIVPQLSDIKKIYQYLLEYKDQTAIFLNDLPKNRYWQEWLKIKKGEAKIIIGTRSAIFAPFADLGLVIIDQEDNENHKQEEPNPRYNVKDVALKIRELLNCRVIFTALSPSLPSLYQAQQKKWQYWEIDKLAQRPEIKVIDRQEEFKKGNYSIFSEELISRLEYNLKRARKVFLFLNRKGLATLAACKDCGYVAACPTCKLPLTLHASKKLVCHHCNYEQNLLLFCPQCQGPNIKLTGSGTEKVAQEIDKAFPLARVIKIDQETPYNQQDFSAYDIIIGTQYAFDFVPWLDVSCIGVINADTSLYLPDFRAGEKTFNNLIKLAGYLADDKKELLIQTFTPDNYIFQAIKNLDYKNFYLHEIKERQLLNYPPVCKLLRLIYQSVEFNGGQREIEEIYNLLKSKVHDTDKIIITPPLLAYTQQVRGRFRWQIIIKILDKDLTLDWLEELPENIIIDRDPENLL